MISAWGIDHGDVSKRLDIGLLQASAKLVTSRKAREAASAAEFARGGIPPLASPEALKRRSISNLVKPFSARPPARRGTLPLDVPTKANEEDLYRGISVTRHDARKMVRAAKKGKPIGDAGRKSGELKSFSNSTTTAARYGTDAKTPWRNTTVLLRAKPGSVTSQVHPTKTRLGESLVNSDLRGAGQARKTKSGNYVIDVRG